MTLSPAMGRYLDMVNNDKPSTNPVTHANENYARELMQPFTIGLNQLNPDGSVPLDSSKNPIPTYTQTNVQALARAFTGWTYAPISGATPLKHNPPNWLAPMVAFESNHDVAQKVLLTYNGSTVTLPIKSDRRAGSRRSARRYLRTSQSRAFRLQAAYPASGHQ